MKVILIYQFDRALIVVLYKEDISNHIANRVNMPRASVKHIMNLIQKTGSIAWKPVTGRLIVTLEGEDYYIANFT